MYYKLTEYRIASNIINLLRDVFKKASITLNNKVFESDREVLQGSRFSPIRFNFYINSLIVKLEANKTFVKALADDLVLG